MKNTHAARAFTPQSGTPRSPDGPPAARLRLQSFCQPVPRRFTHGARRISAEHVQRLSPVRRGKPPQRQVLPALRPPAGGAALDCRRAQAPQTPSPIAFESEVRRRRGAAHPSRRNAAVDHQWPGRAGPAGCVVAGHSPATGGRASRQLQPPRADRARHRKPRGRRDRAGTKRQRCPQRGRTRFRRRPVARRRRTGPGAPGRGPDRTIDRRRRGRTRSAQ